MKMFCWKCGKEYANETDGAYSEMWGLYVCTADIGNNESCGGQLVNEQKYQKILKFIELEKKITLDNGGITDGKNNK